MRCSALGHALVLALLGAACKTGSTDPYRTLPERDRNPLLAQELSAYASELIESDQTEARRLLEDALIADIFYGPAHNNMGVLYLSEGKLYEAAQEFEWARKLMPGHPDPRVNLAFTLEEAGRTHEALQAYEAALEVYPDYLPAIQGLASLCYREGIRHSKVAECLNIIALRSEAADWRTWARDQLATKGWNSQSGGARGR